MQLPAALTSKFSKQLLLAKENAPQLLFAGGISAGVASTVLACKATLNLESTMAKTKSELDDIRVAKETVENGGRPTNAHGEEFDYTVKDAKKDLVIVRTRGFLELIKLYAPALGMGFISVALLTKSQHILNERNAGLAAAYTAMAGAFETYRERVVEDQGEEKDKEYMNGVVEVEEINPDTNRKRKVKAPATAGSPYATFFDNRSSSFSQDPDWNLTYLTGVRNHLNHRLTARGHVFLNEVLTDLGLPHTQAGAVVGWLRDGEGDGVISFGIEDGIEANAEGHILLDFNVDGLMYNRIDED